MSCPSRALEKRLKVEVWHPHARQLKLLHVPEEARRNVRKRLQPWLAVLTHAAGSHPIGVRAGHCWEIAQGLAMTAKDEGVKYIEGVWHVPRCIDHGCIPLPHAWNLVDGHLVDLVEELFIWQGDDLHDHEPLRQFSYAELKYLFEWTGAVGLFPEGVNITSFLWWEEGHGDDSLFPEHLRSDSEPEFLTQIEPSSDRYPNGRWGSQEEKEAWDKFQEERSDFENGIIFRPAVERMVARYPNSGIAEEAKEAA